MATMLHNKHTSLLNSEYWEYENEKKMHILGMLHLTIYKGGGGGRREKNRDLKEKKEVSRNKSSKEKRELKEERQNQVTKKI